MIIKLKKQKLFKVVSHRTGWCMGTYPTKKEAELRLKEIKLFGKKK